MVDKKAGRPTARPEGEKPLTIRVPSSLYRLLKGVASLKGISINDAGTEALREWSAKYPDLVKAIQAEIEKEIAKTEESEQPSQRKAQRAKAKK